MSRRGLITGTLALAGATTVVGSAVVTASPARAASAASVLVVVSLRGAADGLSLVVPHADPAAFPDYLTEPQAGDYPEGRYELGLQTAADAGDQAALDTLFARRSGRQTLQLAVILLVVMMGLALAVKYL